MKFVNFKQLTQLVECFAYNEKIQRFKSVIVYINKKVKSEIEDYKFNFLCKSTVIG